MLKFSLKEPKSTPFAQILWMPWKRASEKTLPATTIFFSVFYPEAKTTATKTGLPLRRWEGCYVHCCPIAFHRKEKLISSVFFFLATSVDFFNDDKCDKISLVIHEVGHNFRFRHSNEDGLYGDRTGYMVSPALRDLLFLKTKVPLMPRRSQGISHDTVGGPAMCFNGHKL